MIFFLFKAFGIGYKNLYPGGEVRVHGDEPKPVIRVKPSESSKYRRYSFVEAVLTLDPVGKLGLVSSDYRVRLLGLICQFYK